MNEQNKPIITQPDMLPFVTQLLNPVVHAVGNAVIDFCCEKPFQAEAVRCPHCGSDNCFLAIDSARYCRDCQRGF